MKNIILKLSIMTVTLLCFNTVNVKAVTQGNPVSFESPMNVSAVYRNTNAQPTIFKLKPGKMAIGTGLDQADKIYYNVNTLEDKPIEIVGVNPLTDSSELLRTEFSIYLSSEAAFHGNMLLNTETIIPQETTIDYLEVNYETYERSEPYVSYTFRKPTTFNIQVISPVTATSAEFTWYNDGVKLGSRVLSLEPKLDGWVKGYGGLYYFDSDKQSTPLQDEWVKIYYSWYYFQENGLMFEKGWKNIHGKWYLFSYCGEMINSGWTKDHNKWYYLSNSGAMLSNQWKLDHNKWYYLTHSGVMAKNVTLKIQNKKYTFNNSGICTTPNGF